MHPVGPSTPLYYSYTMRQRKPLDDMTSQLAVIVCWLLKGATSQVAGSPAVLDQTVIVLDQTVIVLDRTVITIIRRPLISFGLVVGQTVSCYIALRNTPAHRPSQLSPVSVMTDMFIRPCPELHGLFPGARSCAFNAPAAYKRISGTDLLRHLHVLPL